MFLHRKHRLIGSPSQQPWEYQLVKHQGERSSCCILNEAQSLDTRVDVRGFGWILARRRRTRSRSPIGQSKDDLELRIGIVKDLKLSSEINFCGSRHVRSKFKSTPPLWHKSAETCRIAGFWVFAGRAVEALWIKQHPAVRDFSTCNCTADSQHLLGFIPNILIDDDSNMVKWYQSVHLHFYSFFSWKCCHVESVCMWVLVLIRLRLNSYQILVQILAILFKGSVCNVQKLLLHNDTCHR